jgi:hypothetical protein
VLIWCVLMESEPPALPKRQTSCDSPLGTCPSLPRQSRNPSTRHHLPCSGNPPRQAPRGASSSSYIRVRSYTSPRRYPATGRHSTFRSSPSHCIRVRQGSSCSQAPNVEDEGTSTVTVARLALVNRARIVAHLAVDVVGVDLLHFRTLIHQGIVRFEVFAVAHGIIIPHGVRVYKGKAEKSFRPKSLSDANLEPRGRHPPCQSDARVTAAIHPHKPAFAELPLVERDVTSTVDANVLHRTAHALFHAAREDDLAIPTLAHHHFVVRIAHGVIITYGG